MGYYKDPTNTHSAYDNEGYFITGDLGYFDESGQLYIMGRKMETFKSFGIAIWPTEIENILMEHSDIRAACVVGVFEEDIYTHYPAALIVKKDRHTITENEIYFLVAGKRNKKLLFTVENSIFFIHSHKIERPAINILVQEFILWKIYLSQRLEK